MKDKITFNYERDDVTIEMTLDADQTWPEVNEHYLRFLQACGYSFKGSPEIQIIDADEESVLIDDCDCSKMDYVDDIDLWESRQLGADLEYARISEGPPNFGEIRTAEYRTRR